MTLLNRTGFSEWGVREERRRVVASVFDPDDAEFEWMGFENHPNCFHAMGRGIPKDLAKGLFAFLNSTVVDRYFRGFSGHTQVNATDLRSLRYPDRDSLESLGEELPSLDLGQREIDEIVNARLFHAVR